MQAKSKFELPWIEKYRPERLDDIIDHKEKINTLRSLISRNELTHLIFYGLPGTGKCLGKGTLIHMYDGTFKKVEEIIVGDQLMGDDSTPRQVLSTCHGSDQLYKISQSRGTDYVVNEPHILSLMRSKNDRIVKDRARNAYRVEWFENHIPMSKRFIVDQNHTGNDHYRSYAAAYDAAKMFIEKIKQQPLYTGKGSVIDISLKEYINKSSFWKREYKGYKVPINYSYQETLIDPYVLGVWLGDGTSSGTGFTSDDQEIINYLENFATQHNLILKKHPTDNYVYSITSGTKTGGIGRNSFKTSLQTYDLLNNKHIPDDYLHNSREVRLKLLAGIIDTDGNKAQHYYDVTQKSETLADDIMTLCESLGFYCSKHCSVKTCTNSPTRAMGTYVRLYITGNTISDVPVLLQRKKILSNNDRINFLVSNIRVEKLNIGEYYGFELDGNGRFLLHDCTVTHNTSLILACAREIYGDQMSKYILELNASDDRGIETVRKKIPDFVKSSSNKIRLVILDEVDAMTNDAQSALRRVIEKYSKNSRFCLICNNINKIIPGLQSRCTKMRFGYLNTKEITSKLSHIINEEGVKITPNAMERLVMLNRDFRQILNTLQCLHIIKLNDGDNYTPIEPDEINEYLGVPTDQNIEEIVNILVGQPFNQSCSTVQDLFKNNQWNLTDIIHRLTEYIVRNQKMPQKQKYYLIDRLSDIEFKLSHSNDAEIQLYALVSAFQQSLLY
jgi:DNA polymerase III delta prime subunit